jgi:YHS domain-containing protein
MLSLGSFWLFVVVHGILAVVPNSPTEKPLASATEPLTNVLCPVMTDQPALPEYFSNYNGKKIFFCCRECVRLFNTNPEKYLPRLPNVTIRKKAPETTEEWVFRNLERFLDFAEFAYTYRISVLSFCAIAMLFLLSRSRMRRAENGTTTCGEFTRWFARYTTLVMLLALGLCAQLGVSFQNTLIEVAKVRQQLRFAGSSSGGVNKPDYVAASRYLTAYNWPQAFHAVPKGLSATYYRGNDERNDRLFNNGHYLTATFQISIIASDGTEVKAGSSVGNQDLKLRCRITRGPNTADHFFGKGQLNAYLIASEVKEPKDMAIPIKPVVQGQEWVVEGPIGKLDTTQSYSGLRGVWYLGTGGATPSLNDLSPHYAIPYAIQSMNGVIAEESVVWMVATFASPILNGPDADGMWLSDRPIPPIPDGKNVSDPMLLGISKPMTTKK